MGFAHQYRATIILSITLFSPAIALANDKPMPLETVTRKMVVTSGWQSSLLKRDPSLAHWHWDAIPSWTTNRSAKPIGYEKLPLTANQQPSSHYPKPIHLPLPAAPLNVVKPTLSDHLAVKSSLSVSAKYSVSAKHNDGATATYARRYDNSAGAADYHGQAGKSKAEVHGKLLVEHM